MAIIDTPKVTVAIPVYNGEKYIAESIQSILNQDYGDFILLLLNDGSTDNTLEIFNRFKDSRITIVSNNENVGLVKTLNKSLDLCETDYYVRVDADDISLSHRISCQKKFLDANTEVQVLGSNIQTIGSKSEIWKNPETNSEIKFQSFYKPSISHPTVMFRMDHFKRNNYRYSDVFPHQEDVCLWHTILKTTKFHNIQDILVHYRIHEENVTVKNASSRELRRIRFYGWVFNKENLKFSESGIVSFIKVMDMKFSPSKSDIENYFKVCEQVKEHILSEYPDVNSVDANKYISELYHKIFYYIIDKRKSSVFKYARRSKIWEAKYLRYLFSSIIRK